MAMHHLGKTVKFWEAALALHDEFGALGGAKKRIELVEGLASAKYRDSGKEARDAMAAQNKLKAEDDSQEAESAEFTFTEDEGDES